MQLFIEALDVWLFRDGRPFDALSDHRAESVFPPYPSVMQGVIRSHQLTLVPGLDLRDKSAIAKAVGTSTDYNGLRMRGPLLARRSQDGKITRFFPVPANVQVQAGRSCPLKPTTLPEGVMNNAPTPLALLPQGEPEKGEGGGWLDEDNLGRCLAGQSVETVAGRALYQRESRFGIGHDAGRRVTKDGALFEVEFIRPYEGVGLWVEMQGYTDWPQAGMLRIGGEARGASFSQVADLSWPAPPDPLPPRFAVYFATPAYFADGWQPKDWSRFFTGQVTLVAAALHRYESRGGFDWAAAPEDANAHRPTRRYVPAGSVYYFQATGAAHLRPDVVQNALTDYGAEIGFGQMIINKEW